MMRYAVISVNRKYGQANTIQVHDDFTKAQKQAAALNRKIPSCRHVMVPFDTEYYQEEEKND